MKKTALLLIDIQNIYFTKGPYLLQEPEKAAATAKCALEWFRENNMPVIHVQHAFKAAGYTETSEYLNGIYKGVYPVKGEKIVKKKYPNSFLQTDLQAYLQEENIEKLVVAGMMSHMCIDTTVRACQNYGYSVTVIEDACTTKDLIWNGKIISAAQVHESFMAALNGMFATVTTLKEWQK